MLARSAAGLKETRTSGLSAGVRMRFDLQDPGEHHLLPVPDQVGSVDSEAIYSNDLQPGSGHQVSQVPGGQGDLDVVAQP